MTAHPFPATGRIAGIDFGTVRIGVAISDPQRIIASPWETYARGSNDIDAEYFRRLVANEGIVGFVVGLPVHMSGDESEKSRAARTFGEWLARVTQVPVCYHDERFSTVEADRVMAEAKQRRGRRRQLRDQLAAQVMLSSFLESRAAHPPGPIGDVHCAE
jgi:putative Holliday junction resolvase